MKKEIKFTVNCEIYKTKFAIIFANNVNATADKYYNDNNFGKALAATIRYKDGSSMIIMPNDNEMDYPVLAHECSHAVTNLFCIRGVVVVENNIEHFAYALEWLMREIIKKWKRIKKKNETLAT